MGMDLSKCFCVFLSLVSSAGDAFFLRGGTLQLQPDFCVEKARGSRLCCLRLVRRQCFRHESWLFTSRWLTFLHFLRRVSER